MRIKTIDTGSCEQLARHVAAIMGEQSAAHAALEQVDEARANGKKATIFQSGQNWIVQVLPAPETICSTS